MASRHCGLGQLIGIHLAKTLVSLNWFLIAFAGLLELDQQGLKFGLRVGVDDLVCLAAGIYYLNSMQRRHGGINSPILDQRSHVAIDEGQ